MAQISRWLHVCWKKELHPIQSNTNCQTINDKAAVFFAKEVLLFTWEVICMGGWYPGICNYRQPKPLLSSERQNATLLASVKPEKKLANSNLQGIKRTLMRINYKNTTMNMISTFCTFSVNSPSMLQLILHLLWWCLHRTWSSARRSIVALLKQERLTEEKEVLFHNFRLEHISVDWARSPSSTQPASPWVLDLEGAFECRVSLAPL